MGSGPSLAVDVTLNTILDEEQRARYMDPGAIRTILATTKTIAIALNTFDLTD